MFGDTALLEETLGVVAGEDEEIVVLVVSMDVFGTGDDDPVTSM